MEKKNSIRVVENANILIQVCYRNSSFISSPASVPIDPESKLNALAKKVASHLLTTIARKECLSGEFYFSTEDTKWIPTVEELLLNVANVIHVSPVIHPTGPKPLPFVGNIYDILPDPIQGFYKQFQIHGPAVKMTLLGRETIMTNDPNIAEIFLKESEYITKKIVGVMKFVKDVGGNGLFTTDTSEHEWTLAHNLLMPAFSPKAMKAYTDEMTHIGQKMVKVFNEITSQPSADLHIINITEWMTNVTFETIGQIGFGYSFGMLESMNTKPHAFLQAMGYCLLESANRTFRPPFANRLYFSSNKRFDREMKLMKDTVDDVIKARKASADATNAEKDLLGFMLNAQDEHTKQKLSDELIRDEVITFLIAGHETTSITLSWLLYQLHCNPDVEAKLLQEIVNVLGDNDESPTAAQVSQLKYLEQCLKETLRLHPPLAGIIKYCQKDCIVPGGYLIPGGSNVSISVYSIHHNEKIFENPFKFNPDRWVPSEESKRSTYSWLPFSIGARGCIGRQFAMQEAKIIAAMILRKFKFVSQSDNVKYEPLGLTLRPSNLRMKVVNRNTLPKASEDFTRMHDNIDISEKLTIPTLAEMQLKNIPPLDILYGSNTGTAQDIATVIASASRNFGITDVTLSPMDRWKGLELLSSPNTPTNFDKSRVLLIVTSTYNGQPPENADNFNSIITKAQAIASSTNTSPLEGICYMVFGCGNKQWRTYQSFPVYVDNTLENLGARRFFARGEGNADVDLETDFQNWFNLLLAFMSEKYVMNAAPPARLTGNPEPLVSGVDVTFIPVTSSKYKEAAQTGPAKIWEPNQQPQVTRNFELQNKAISGRSTRHITVKFEGKAPSFSAGDHLEVMPVNTDDFVQNFASRVGLVLDAAFVVDSISENAQIGSRSLASSITGPCTIRNALKYYADLLAPVPRTILWVFSDILKAAGTNSEIEEMLRHLSHPGSKKEYNEFIQKYRTIMDVLDAFPQIKSLSVTELLCGLQVMSPRRYSISSSPLLSKNSMDITVGVVKDVVGDTTYPGLCSEFLSSMENGTKLNATVRLCKDEAFRPPTDPKLPVIMVCAGTGISPFRGFLQNRRATGFKSIEKGGVSQTILYFGCRNDSDLLYREELLEYVNDGTLDKLYLAYSRPEDPKKKRYVQQLLLENAKDVWTCLNEKNGKLFVCGNASGMAKDVLKVIEEIHVQLGGMKADEAEEHVSSLEQNGKVVMDVWG
ncbi:hypothetical protein HK098_003832 [Nowakowskiella sp. JEL0407]|nr:hypothetical protein HK098_003832 [Nowakowskiella sp. JEL0407]